MNLTSTLLRAGAFNFRRYAVAFSLTGVCALPFSLAAAKMTVDATSAPNQWTIRHEGKPVMVYAFEPQTYKAYVKELYSSSGRNVLRDSPADHLHHHALMYGIKVNGVNFWEEISGSGVEKVIEPGTPELGVGPDGTPFATLKQLLYWLMPQDAFLPNTNAPALLIERRVLTVRLNTAGQETAVHWHSTFQVGTKTNTVVLTGSNYHGLGMRFPLEFDPVATHFTSAGKPDLSENKQDASAHAWEAVGFNLAGNPITVACVGGPGNARGDSLFFSMRTPFAYLAATQGLDREPLVYHSGDRFALDFLVLVYSELKSPEFLSERSRTWANSLR
jgi:hypothetical protein